MHHPSEQILRVGRRDLGSRRGPAVHGAARPSREEGRCVPVADPGRGLDPGPGQSTYPRRPRTRGVATGRSLRSLRTPRPGTTQGSRCTPRTPPSRTASENWRTSSTCPARAPVNYDTGEPGAPSGCPSGAPWAHVTVTTDGVTLWTNINGRRIVAAEPVGGRGDDGGLYHRVRPEAVGFVRGEGDREHLGGPASARHDLDNVSVRAKCKPDTRAVAVLRRRATVLVLNL